ncbi:proline-rich protein 36-like isoform X1 [Chroicocephalus ridibundus]|uniref:proline-rich protein 36-like isoform X1 n=2 Tax=Chroicocephalus ridibundus TaxID=1192867 RepID=UPI002FDE2C5D
MSTVSQPPAAPVTWPPSPSAGPPRLPQGPPPWSPYAPRICPPPLKCPPAGGAAPMPDQPEGPGVDTEPPGAPPKKTGGGRVAQPPPASDSEKDSGLSDASSEDLSGREQTDTEEPPSTGTQPAPLRHPLTTLTPGHPFACLAPIYLVHSLFLQQPLALPPLPWQPAQLLLLQPPPPAAPRHEATVPRHEATAACHEATASVGSPGSRNRHLGATAELLRQQGLLAAALRTGTLLRQNRRTQREIVALRRQSRLLARVARDPRAWPRLCHALGGGDPLGPPTPCREPPAFGEGVGVGVRGEKGVPNASPPCVLPLRPWGPPGTGALNSTERRGGRPPGFADTELKEHLVRS